MKCKQTIIILTAGILLAASLPYFAKAQTLPDYSFQKKETENKKQMSQLEVDPGGNPDVPVDGGISLLLAAGAAYGIKKARNYRKK